MTTATKITAETAYDIYVTACMAAEKAAADCTPTPMIVGMSKGLWDNAIDEDKKTYYVASGVCGYADVIIRPATGPFVSMLKKRGVGRKNYYGGWSVRSYEFAGSTRSSQSLEIASAAAKAAAAVLKDAGLNAYVSANMD